MMAEKKGEMEAEKNKDRTNEARKENTNEIIPNALPLPFMYYFTTLLVSSLCKIAAPRLRNTGLCCTASIGRMVGE
jgi:hypothetical protein